MLAFTFWACVWLLDMCNQPAQFELLHFDGSMSMRLAPVTYRVFVATPMSHMSSDTSAALKDDAMHFTSM